MKQADTHKHPKTLVLVLFVGLLSLWSSQLLVPQASDVTSSIVFETRNATKNITNNRFKGLKKKVDSIPVQQDDNSLRFPPAAIFLNGNPSEPQYQWTYTFSRFLGKQFANQSTSIYVTQAREAGPVLELIKPSKDSDGKHIYNYSLESDPAADLRPVPRKEGRKVVLPVQKLIFTRAQTIPNLIEKYPQMFRFCERSKAPIDSGGSASCPVFVHFPVGRESCQTCSEKWHLVIPDDQHAKPVSDFVWSMIHQIHRGSYPAQVISQKRFEEIVSKNCSVAFVSAWSEKKGQERLAQELTDYHRLGLLKNTIRDFPLTICFAGDSNKSQQLVKNTMESLASLGISAHDLGHLTLVEQIVLFAHAKKSVLLTRSDHSPRVVYLSLASGARVLTTERSRVASSVVDNDCLVTELNFFDNSTTVSERANAFLHFLSRSDGCDIGQKGNVSYTTLSKAFDILREDLQYGPIVHQALEMWRKLNLSNRENDCVHLFTNECEQYRKARIEIEKKMTLRASPKAINTRL